MKLSDTVFPGARIIIIHLSKGIRRSVLLADNDTELEVAPDQNYPIDVSCIGSLHLRPR
jgi:hypothetical protein